MWCVAISLCLYILCFFLCVCTVKFLGSLFPLQSGSPPQGPQTHDCPASLHSRQDYRCVTLCPTLPLIKILVLQRQGPTLITSLTLPFNTPISKYSHSGDMAMIYEFWGTHFFFNQVPNSINKYCSFTFLTAFHFWKNLASFILKRQNSQKKKKDKAVSFLMICVRLGCLYSSIKATYCKGTVQKQM